jgi:hypothetical protein
MVMPKIPIPCVASLNLPGKRAPRHPGESTVAATHDAPPVGSSGLEPACSCDEKRRNVVHQQQSGGFHAVPRASERESRELRTLPWTCAS